MSSFEPETFLSKPDQEEFLKLKKAELMLLGQHLELEVKETMKKSEIQSAILKHLVSKQIFEESVLKSMKSPVSTLELELKRLEIEQLRIKNEEREKQRQHELEMKKLELQSNPHRSGPNSEKFDITKNIRLVPPFQEKEVDKYFFCILRKSQKILNGLKLHGQLCFKVSLLAKLVTYLLS